MAKKKKAFRVITRLIAVIFISIIGIGIYFYNGLSNLSKNSQLNNLNATNKETEIQEEDKTSINILALGVDIGTPGSKSEKDPKRTDTMMLLNYNAENKELRVISIPRDTLIKINGKNAKINAAHAVGGTLGAIEAVEKLLDVQIDYYGKVNYEGFRALIDSIGGVDVKIDNNMNYDDPAQDLHIHFKKGENVHLDGKKAEEFFRWRKNNDGTGLLEGDIGRIDNQHYFISQVINKIKSPWIIPRVPSILMTLPKYCETNMEPDEIIKYGYAFMKASKIEMITLKGDDKYIKGISYFIYDEKYNKEILNELHGTNIEGKNIKIKILNCTNIQGLASNYREFLKSKGYSNIFIGNGEPINETKILINNNLNNGEIQGIKQEFKINIVEILGDNEKKFDIIVMLGKNYRKINNF